MKGYFSLMKVPSSYVLSLENVWIVMGDMFIYAYFVCVYLQSVSIVIYINIINVTFCDYLNFTSSSSHLS